MVVLIRADVTQRVMYPKMQTKAVLVSKVRMLENQRHVMVVPIKTFVQVGRQRRRIQILMR
jgi:ribosomal protein L18E